MIKTILIFLLSLVLWYRTFIFYAPDQNVADRDEYSVAVWAHAGRDNYRMVDMQPQNVQFFVEEGTLLYQPPHTTDPVLCPQITHPYLAFLVDPHTPVCRRGLSFLKRHVYTRLVYKRKYAELTHPIVTLRHLMGTGILRVRNPPTA